MGLKAEKITPYGTLGDTRSKSEQVEEMFDSIAPAYDTMNRAMTFGLDLAWRRKAVRMVAADRPRAVLDVATGTGDLALALAKALPEATITGIDLSQGMLEVGRRKVREAGLDSRITFMSADCLALPFADDTFDAITVAYGVRNFEHLDQGYHEMHRVLRPGGLLCVIELSTPTNPLVRPFYKLYTRTLVPALGRLMSKDTRAYSYLPESIAAVPQGRTMLDLMEHCGFRDATDRRLTFGVCSIYTARK